MQQNYSMTPAESFRYTGTFSPDVSEMLLEQHEALERIRDAFYDIDLAIEDRKPKTVLHHLAIVNSIFEEIGL